jgi:hypothetical protein
MGDRSDRCATCGRKRGLEQQRRSWGTHPTVWIPCTDDPEDNPAQSSNDLICSVSVYRNGGAGEDTHLCDRCLRIGLRAVKVAVSEALEELDADHDKDATIADLTERLGLLQAKHYNVCFDHDRMQGRMGDLLKLVPKTADREVVRMAEFEVSRGPASTPRKKDGV